MRERRVRRWRAAAVVAVAVAAASVLAVPAAVSGAERSHLAGMGVVEARVLAADVVYDARRDLVYASVPSADERYGNEVVAVDPVSGAVRRSVWVGSEPGALALSDDRSTLYVGLRGANQVARVDLGRFALADTWPLGGHSFHGPSYAEDLAVQPGDPDVVVASLFAAGVSPRHVGVVALDDGVARPVRTPGHTGANRITFGPDRSTLYGYNNETTGFGVYTLSLAHDGVRVLRSSSRLVSGFYHDVEFSDGRLYASSGRVVDPVDEVVLGTYPVAGAVEPVPRQDRTYVLTGGSLVELHRTRFNVIDALEVADVQGSPSALVATGSGLAGVTRAGELLLFAPGSAPRPTTTTTSTTSTTRPPTTTTTTRPPAPTPPPPTTPAGYRLLEADGTVHTFGRAAHAGDAHAAGGTATAMAVTPSSNGYLALFADGRVVARGDAPYLGGLEGRGGAALHDGERAVSIAVTPTGRGYWIFTSTGRVVAFGDARFHGDLQGLALHRPIVAATPTTTGSGYHLLGADGGVFAFGDARFVGSLPGVLGGRLPNCPVTGIVATPTGDGYWMVACDGGVFAFGDAYFVGSLPGIGVAPVAPVVGMVPWGAGYVMVGADGGVFVLGEAPFFGSLGGRPPRTPVVAITPHLSSP